MKPLERLIKTIQKRTYDFLLTKYGIFLLCLSLTIIFICLIQLSDSLIEYRLENMKRFTERIYFDRTLPAEGSSDENIGAEYFDFQPKIDAVYTWVNGSDPDHLKHLQKYKLENNELSFHNTTPKHAKVEFNEFIAKFTGPRGEDTAEWTCHHKLCMQTNNLIVIVPQLAAETKKSFIKEAKLVFDAEFTIETHAIQQENEANKSFISVLTFLAHDLSKNMSSLQELNALFSSKQLFKDHKIYMGFYTIDCNLAPNCIRDINRTYIAKQLRPAGSSSSRASAKLAANSGNPSILFPSYLSENLLFKKDFVHMPPMQLDEMQTSLNVPKNKPKFTEILANSPQATYLSVFQVKSKQIDKYLSGFVNADSKAEKLVYTSNVSNSSYDLYSANIVWDLGDPFTENIAANRFQDNDELKYSLRSLEKFAPWIRNVYLVTNGQVPNWLNRSNPRLRLVTHQQIFPNRTHLPTFSSPAIESHLHRIKGLSKRFIYFNDDFILGKPIWLDDFYTQSKGFKFQLAWQLPGCSPKCPNAWIRDGYCDKACNNSLCEFDGGDCNKTQTFHADVLQNETQRLTTDFYCSAGCSTSWLADKYCDNACDNLKCAYDMGDCGLDNLKQKFLQIKLVNSATIPARQVLKVPPNTLAFYINFTTPDVGNSFRILKAKHEEAVEVRKVSVINRYKIITVLLMPDALTRNSSFEFDIFLTAQHEYGLNQTSSEEFNIHLTIEANSLDYSTTTTTETSVIEATSTKKSVKKKIKKLGKKIEPEQEFLMKNISFMLPENLKFENHFLRETYENYANYLNWSRHHGLLTNYGYEYKLILFYEKLVNEINPTYAALVESMQQNEAAQDADILTESIFRLLFDNKFFLNDYDRAVLVARFINETDHKRIEGDKENLFLKFKKRKLLDTFADSLRHVNKLFNQVYGVMARKVPAHMPHLIGNEFFLTKISSIDIGQFISLLKISKNVQKSKPKPYF